MRQAWYFMDDESHGQAGNYFLIPSDCSMIWVTGGGGGAGGFGAMSIAGSAGAESGGSAAVIIRYPLAVIPNGFIGIQVGMGGLGGRRFGWGSSRLTTNTSGMDSTACGTWLWGDIVSPEVTDVLQLFCLGYAGDSPPVARGRYGKTVVSENELSYATISSFWGLPFNACTPALTFENGKNFLVNTASFGMAGMDLGPDKGHGDSGSSGALFGSYGSMSYGHFGYSDGGPVGPGGGGGGNPFGKGGDGGSPWVSNGAGQDGQGYCSGGGGGCYGAPGGNGAHGFLLIEY